MIHRAAPLQFVTNLTDLQPTKPTLLTIGKFDGVHRAHQHLIATLVERAHQQTAQSAVLTFDPHPDEILRPERDIRYLTTIQERAELIEQLGVDLMIALPFTYAVSQLTPFEFMNGLSQSTNIKELWVGPDFKLGHRAKGTIPVLREIGEQLDYTVHPIEVWTIDDEPVRSTSIRDLLRAGNVSEAHRYLGRPFSLQGLVIQGDQRGRTIGFPTANLAIPARHVVPANGVYASTVRIVELEQTVYGVTNIGIRPTFGTLQQTIETHLFDFDQDIYGKHIQLAFIERIRDEQRFESPQQLVEQITQDSQQARNILTRLI